MDIDTLAAILGLFGGREVVSYLLSRRKTQAEVRATDAGTAGEIVDAAGGVVGLQSGTIKILEQQRDDFKAAYDETLELFKDAEAFKTILEVQMKSEGDARRALEEKVAKQGEWIDDLQRRLQDSSQSLNELRGLKPAMTHLAEEVVDLQDQVKTLKTENKKLRGQVKQLKTENAELREQMNDNGHPAG
jgi:chromosome segregation ATPase